MANVEDDVPATSQTLYRLASVSKSLTATAAMIDFTREQIHAYSA